MACPQALHDNSYHSHGGSGALQDAEACNDGDEYSSLANQLVDACHRQTRKQALHNLRLNKVVQDT
jgi:hypothetical protein